DSALFEMDTDHEPPVSIVRAPAIDAIKVKVSETVKYVTTGVLFPRLWHMWVMPDYQICACVDHAPELLSPLRRGERHQLIAPMGKNDNNVSVALCLADRVFSRGGGKPGSTRCVAGADTEFAFAERENLEPDVPW